MMNKSTRVWPRYLVASIVYTCSALSLYLVLRVISAGQVTAVNRWASFLTWRLPLLLATSSFLTLMSSRNLKTSTRTTIARTDTSIWLIASAGIAIHLFAPLSGEPQLWLGLFYLGLLTAKASVIATTILILQKYRPITSPMLFLLMLWFFGFFAVWNGPIHRIHGDEPHYLLMTHSIVYDGDLNLFNQYQEKIHQSFGLQELEPKLSDNQSPGKIYSRGLGATFPALLAPSYMMGGLQGSQFFMVICSAFMITQLYILLMRSVSNSRLVLAAVLLIASTNPVLTYSSLIYPDIPAALCIVVGLRILQIQPLSRNGRSVPTWIFMLSAILIFLKFRYFVPVILLMTPVIHREFRKIRNAMVLIIALATLAGAYIAADRWLLEGDLFSNRFGGFEKIRSFFPTFDSLQVFPGLLLDQESGFLFHAPVYLLFFAGLAIYRGRRDSLYWFSVLGIPFTAVSLLGHFAWHCLPTPPLRYMLPVLPPLALFIATALTDWKKRSLAYRTIVSSCIVLSWSFAGILSIKPEWQLNLADGSSQLFVALATALKSPVPLFFPSAIRPGMALWIWIFASIPIIGVFMLPSWRNTIKDFRFIRLKTVVIIPLGILVLLGFATRNTPIRVYHGEDRWWTAPDGGTYFPENRDPFFHHERSYGWQIGPAQSIRFPLRIFDTHATGLIRCKLVDSWLPQKLMIQSTDGTATERVLVTSKNWVTFAFKLHPELPLREIRITSGEETGNAVAIDWIRIVPRSPRRSAMWVQLANFFRRTKWSRLAFECDRKSLLTGMGDPWYEFSSHYHSGAIPKKTKIAAANPIASELLEMTFQDAIDSGWEEIRSLENLFQISFSGEISPDLERDYAVTGLLKGHHPAAKLIASLAVRYPDDETLQLLSAIAWHLRGNPLKSAVILDELLVNGSYYPMRLTTPSMHLEINHPLFPLLEDIENNSDFRTHARILCERHLVESMADYNKGDIRAAAVHFDNYYLCDQGIFMEVIPGVSQEYVSEMFKYASRIHTIHARMLIESALTKHRPSIALAAAEYGLRMNPGDAELMFGKARSLFHKRDYLQARQACLDNISLFQNDDRSRWLIEQILIHMKEDGDRLGGVAGSSVL